MMQLYYCTWLNILYLINTKELDSKYEYLNLNSTKKYYTWEKSVFTTNANAIKFFSSSKDYELIDEWED